MESQNISSYMFRIFLLILLLALSFRGLAQKANGDRYYGGIFRYSEAESIKTLFPPSIQDAVSNRTALLFYEGLYKYDHKTMEVIPSLAKGIPEINNGGKTYTVKLKEKVYFHQDACFEEQKIRELTANDVKYCFDFLCSASADNLNAPLFNSIIKGGKEYYDHTVQGRTPQNGVEGIKVIDRYTIQFELEEANILFIHQLARTAASIYPKEAYEQYGKDMHRKHVVGTGPFKLVTYDLDIKVVGVKNINYHGRDEFGNTLPFLKGVEISFIKDQNVVFRLFELGELDMMYRVAPAYLEQLKKGEATLSENKKTEVQTVIECATFFLGFNIEKPPFDNKNLRKALNFAVDRKAIIKLIYNTGTMGHYGLTPPIFNNYDVTTINGYFYNQDSAKFYLKKSRYLETYGSQTPLTLNYSPIGGISDSVVLIVQKQIKENLGLEIDINPLTRSAHIESVRSGDAGLYRFGWLADYPHPESFLYFFHSSVSSLFTRYDNSTIDELYEKALKANDEKGSYALLLKAEQILIQDAPIIPLWYDHQTRILRYYVNNFPKNAFEYRDFSEVFFLFD